MKSPKYDLVPNAAGRLYVCAILIGTVFLTEGCTTMTEQQLQAREYRNTEFELQFREFRRQCVAGGKRVFIDAIQKVGRDGLPHNGDRYYCA